MYRRGIEIVMATEASVAAIKRTDDFGSSQLIRWDTRTDRLDFGQWITSRMDSWDLSPDGRHVVASFTDERPERRQKAIDAYGLTRRENSRMWTAVSVLPYFTAVALWFDGLRRVGGGIWESDTRLLLNRSEDCEEAISPPDGLTVVSIDPLTEDWMSRERSDRERRGWRHVGERRWERQGPGLLLVRDWPRASVVHEEGWLVREWPAHNLGGVFLDFDQRGRVVFIDKRSVFAWEGCPEGKPKMIVDLSEAKFEAVPPPPDYRARF